MSFALLGRKVTLRYPIASSAATPEASSWACGDSLPGRRQRRRLAVLLSPREFLGGGL